MGEEILLLKIHQTLNRGRSYYEATSGNWRISNGRCSNIRYVAGVNNGKVVCAYQPSKWEVIKDGPDQGRKRFEGVEAPPEILAKLQKAEEKVLNKFGSGNPVAYMSLAELNEIS